jgi:hypothetical protein
MEQQDLNSEIDEFVPQDQEVAHEQIEQEQELQPEMQAKPDKSREHFRRLEQSKRELERELSFQRELNERLVKQVPQSPAPVQEVDELDAIADDDFIPKGKVRALVRKEALKIASEVSREEQKKYAQQQHQATFMNRLKGKYLDFDQVVNHETLALLEQDNPELAQTIAETQDPYKIGLQSYNYIKAMGLHKTVEDSPRAKEIEKKLVANNKTVQSPQAFTKRPMAQAFSSSDADKKALFDEMNASARLSGFSY